MIQIQLFPSLHPHPFPLKKPFPFPLQRQRRTISHKIEPHPPPSLHPHPQLVAAKSLIRTSKIYIVFYIFIVCGGLGNVSIKFLRKISMKIEHIKERYFKKIIL